MKGPTRSDRTKDAGRAARWLRRVLNDIVTDTPDFDAADVSRVAELIRGVESLEARLYEDDINEWAEQQPEAVSE